MSIAAGQRIAFSVDLKILHNIIEQHIAASPYVVGVELARQIDRHVREQRLGYYPALDYFQGKDIVDSDLYNTAESIAWLLENLARQSLRENLRPLLAELEFESTHVHIYILPHVRPSQDNAIHRLTSHFTPDHLRVAISGVLKFGASDEETLLKEAHRRIEEQLDEDFSRHEISGMKLI